MKKHVLFIQGGGQGAYEADGILAAYLQDALGSEYEILYPKMPDEARPRYAAWKDQLAKELAMVNGQVILVGHSLGGSILLKYLSEEKPAKPISGLFLIAPPFWGADDWQVDEYALQENFAEKLPAVPGIFFYHSSDDEWVPFAHLALYAEKLPQAAIRKFDGRGHQFNNDLSEVVADIKSLKSAAACMLPS